MERSGLMITGQNLDINHVSPVCSLRCKRSSNDDQMAGIYRYTFRIKEQALKWVNCYLATRIRVRVCVCVYVCDLDGARLGTNLGGKGIGHTESQLMK